MGLPEPRGIFLTAASKSRALTFNSGPSQEKAEGCSSLRAQERVDRSSAKSQTIKISQDYKNNYNC
jgi:hypothetical protein